ncbi:MAG: polyvinylalcohol dehydrogenase [Planctomyces sp.]|nr:polyvinylalcohol dehydrogenase [Planctomyces sp.]
MPQQWNRLGLTICLLAVSCGFSCKSLMAADRVEASGDWPQWRGANRDGISTDKNLLGDWSEKTPELLYEVAGLGAGYASVSIVDDVLYTSGNKGSTQSVTAVDLKTKKIKWSTPITRDVPKHGYEGSRTTPAVVDGKVYAVASSGAIVCLNASDGKPIWRKDFAQEFGGKMMSSWGFSESPLVDGERVLCTPGGNNAMMVALQKNSGKLMWKSNVPDFGEAGKPGAGYSSIVVSEAGGIRQYVQLVGRGLIGVQATNGKPLWGYNRVANPTANIPTPIPSGDYVFASSGYSEGGSALVKINRKGATFSADEVYYKPASELQNHHGGMVMIGDHVYMGHGHNNGFPVCVEWMTGQIVWGGRQRGAGSGSAAVVAADGNVIYRYQSGEVALVEASPKGYNLKGAFTPKVANDPCWSHPVVVDQKLFLRDQDVLMVYDLAAKN